MTKTKRTLAVLAVSALLSGAMGFAESGEAIYKANCASCHGSSGTPSPGMAKMMGVKAAADYKTSAAEMATAVKDGKGKMKAFSGKLSDAQIKDVIAYFRTLK